MIFSSISFLTFFLPVVLLLYFMVPKRFRNLVLLIASLLFYFFGEPVYVWLLIFSSISDWLHSLYIEAHRGEKKAKAALISSVVINLLMLGIFKYTDFFIETINLIFHAAIPVTGIALPIGISFFTFQTMSYTIDVYRGTVHANKNLTTFATFVCLFPQLIAGPIVRYSDIEAELTQRNSGLGDIAAGFSRFVIGLGKKVLLANRLGELCALFRASGEQSVLFYWIYAVAFSLQIYFDFSGYSDMAIGLGRMFGFTFPENFNYPYISKSITEFWRRWHITLGSWLRDYVYIPLGGNRTDKKWKWFRNILIVWMLTGLWHGAEWNFVLWGLYFGIWLVIEKLLIGKLLSRAPKAISHLYVIFLVVISFTIFNADKMAGVINDLGAMFGARGLPAVTNETLYYLRSYAAVFVIALIAATPLPKRLMQKLSKVSFVSWAEPVLLAVLFVICTGAIVNGSYNPFLYFRF